MKCNNRLFTDQPLKNKIIFSSLSSNNINWGKKNFTHNNSKDLIETITAKNIFNPNLKRLNEVDSKEKEKIEIIKNNEKDQKRKEELSRKREMSLNARKKIILRIKQHEKDNGKSYFLGLYEIYHQIGCHD